MWLQGFLKEKNMPSKQKNKKNQNKCDFCVVTDWHSEVVPSSFSFASHEKQQPVTFRASRMSRSIGVPRVPLGVGWVSEPSKNAWSSKPQPGEKMDQQSPGVFFQINKGKGYTFLQGSFWDDDKHEDVLPIENGWTLGILHCHVIVYRSVFLDVQSISCESNKNSGYQSPASGRWSTASWDWIHYEKKSHIPSLGPLLKSKLAFLGLMATYKKFPQFSFWRELVAT